MRETEHEQSHGSGPQLRLQETVPAEIKIHQVVPEENHQKKQNEKQRQAAAA
jgi:hypothetical protein